MNTNRHTHPVHTERGAWFTLATAVKPGAYIYLTTTEGDVEGPIGYHTGDTLFLMNGPAIPLHTITSITHTAI